ncbi:hypothetical protein ACOJCM_10215 [Billgrantia sp. LNSP4103-1]|uniref:hypothetical protein n=1 Tax=Billgrantia sp. LNSP4103-1 TaxID=3410266 RepID=UPI00403F58FA
MATTDEMLKASLILQTEILARLEALERAQSGNTAATFDQPTTEVLRQIRDMAESGGYANLNRELEDLLARLNREP